MQSQSREVKEVKSSSEDSLLREVVGNLINGKLEKISLMVATNEASEEDLAYNQLLLEMRDALPEKNRANLFDDFDFLQQDQYQHQNADEGEDEGDYELEHVFLS